MEDSLTGFGFIIKQPWDKSIENIKGSGNIGKAALVFQGEITAVTQSVLTLQHEIPLHTQLTINYYVDSHPALKALYSPARSSQTVQTCCEALCIHGCTHKITLNWVKAHDWHELNEIADDLAKAGTTTNNHIPVHPPIKTLYNTKKLTQLTHGKRDRRET